MTYDLRTVPFLLKRWDESGNEHAGVVFVDSRSIPQAKIGWLARALRELWYAERDHDWRNRVVFLTRRAGP